MTEDGSRCYIVLRTWLVSRRSIDALSRKFFCNITPVVLAIIPKGNRFKSDRRASSRIESEGEGKEKREKVKEEEEDARITGSRGAFSFQRTKLSFSRPIPGHRAAFSFSLPLFPARARAREEETFLGKTLFHPIQSLCLHRAEVDGPLTQFFKWIADAARVPRILPHSLLLSVLPLSPFSPRTLS